ncbi:Gonadotropin-releasing hormone II receptor [Myotis davidii]|uniref:Gonadotropin-releasing hormone II receptor n=1 Tax=Myotis davidii TaxID=225400 RepID=L5LWK8_MYODS|nr:Gonadotropin-releasing hormone II receptor [Myotis davidii]
MTICYRHTVFSVSSSPTRRAEWFWMAVYFLNPKPTSEFALGRSLDNHPVPVHLRPALLTLLTSVLYRIPPYSLVLSHDANRSSSQPLPLLFGLISAPLGHLQGAFTLGCQSGHQELCIDSSRESESGRIAHLSPSAAGGTNECGSTGRRNKKKTFL